MAIKLKSAETGFFLLVVTIVAVAAFFMLSGNESQKTETISSGGDRILVIDPGHGGSDGGATSVYGTHESAINLEISRRMQAIAHLTATPCVMTREKGNIDYPPEAKSLSEKKSYDQKRRVELIESIPGALLISVHQNEFVTAKPRGPQVFYGADKGSFELAKLTQSMLTQMLYPQNRRVAAPISKGLYVFRKVTCTTILAECGFLSNPAEALLLENNSYQIKTALALMSSYFQYTNPEMLLS